MKYLNFEFRRLIGSTQEALRPSFGWLVWAILLALVISVNGEIYPSSQDGNQDDHSNESNLGGNERPEDSDTIANTHNPEGEDFKEEDESEMLELLSILDEETELVTKTKLNRDYVPGMITILQGDELNSLGIRTVWEALSLVPGIQILRSGGRSDPSVIVRGLSFPFNSGNIKVLVNSIPMSREDSGINSSVLLLPIEQVERIEFIRGPGSSLYGSFAFMGLLNIITRTNENAVFGVLEENDTFRGGGRFSWSESDGPLSLHANFSSFNSEDSFSRANAESDEERIATIFGLSYGNITLTTQFVNRDLSADDDRFVDQKNWVVDLRQGIEFSPTTGAVINGSFLRTDNSTNSGEFKGDRIEANADFSWNGLASQTWLLGMSFSYSDLEEGRTPGPPPPGGPPPGEELPPGGPPPGGPPPGGRPPRPTQVNGKVWRSYGLSLMNTIDFTERLTLTLGLRYDHRDDIDEGHITPRAAIVWQAHDRHLFKAQFTEGFRAPTFFELYAGGSENLDFDFARIESSEIGYVYKRPTSVGRLTLFYSSLKDMISPSRPPTPFANNAEARIQGVELEWNQQFTDKLKGTFNVSYVDSQDSRGGAGGQEESLSEADWIGNVAILARPIQNLLFTCRWYHVSDRRGATSDINGFDTVDLSANVFDPLIQGLTLRAGISNIFDDEITYLTGVPIINFPEYPGRSAWIEISYDF